MAASNDLGQWYKSIPLVTRAWFTSAAAVPLAARLGLVSPMSLILDIGLVIRRFQVCFIYLLIIRSSIVYFSIK